MNNEEIVKNLENEIRKLKNELNELKRMKRAYQKKQDTFDIF